MTARGRGRCRVCGARQRLGADGRVVAHTVVIPPAVPPGIPVKPDDVLELVDCDGWGRLPLEASS